MNNSNEAYLISIRRKLREEGVKVAAIISKCEKVDRNRDYSIHIDDLEEILQDCLKESKLTRRELNFLLGQLTHDRRRGNIEYMRLSEVLEGQTQLKPTEKWYEEPSKGGPTGMPRGSVGEFLENAACPAEVENFQRFIAALEQFERASGMKVKPTENGFTVPFGPDLRASIAFSMSREA